MSTNGSNGENEKPLAIRRFVETSSIESAAYLTSSRSRFEIGYWAIITLLLAIVTIIQIGFVIAQYTGMPTGINIRPVLHGELSLPNSTICLPLVPKAILGGMEWTEAQEILHSLLHATPCTNLFHPDCDWFDQNGMELECINDLAPMNTPKYIGTMNSTIRGEPCLNWLSNAMVINKAWITEESRRIFGTGDHNFCRETDDGFAWCYVGTADKWDYCIKQRCSLVEIKSIQLECINHLVPMNTPKYTGTVDKTISGKHCLSWLSNATGINKAWITEESQEMFGTGNHNFCRETGDGYAWCYIDTEGKWELCIKHLCSFDGSKIEKTEPECIFPLGTSPKYMGKMNRTYDGKPCLNWLSKDSAYINEEIQKVYGTGDHNFCRETDTDYTWCYVDTAVEWDYCIKATCNYNHPKMKMGSTLLATAAHLLIQLRLKDRLNCYGQMGNCHDHLDGDVNGIKRSMMSGLLKHLSTNAGYIPLVSRMAKELCKAISLKVAYKVNALPC